MRIDTRYNVGSTVKHLGTWGEVQQIVIDVENPAPHIRYRVLFAGYSHFPPVLVWLHEDELEIT